MMTTTHLLKAGLQLSNGLRVIPQKESYKGFDFSHMLSLPSVCRYAHGATAQYNVPLALVNLTKVIQKKSREREEEKVASGGGDIFFMRSPNDLTGCEGELLFFEYSEEYPPLMMQVSNLFCVLMACNG